MADSDDQGKQAKQAQKPADFQQMYRAGGKFAQKVEEVAGRKGGAETEPVAAREKPVELVEEIPTQVEMEKKPELAGYIEKVEKEAELAQPIIDDYTGQVLLKPAQPQNVTVTLPMTEGEVVEGLHHKVWESIRWLAEWCIRQIKVLHGKVRYREQTPQS